MLDNNEIPKNINITHVNSENIKKLQKAIWDLCEAGELISTTAIELQCLKR